MRLPATVGCNTGILSAAQLTSSSMRCCDPSWLPRGAMLKNPARIRRLSRNAPDATTWSPMRYRGDGDPRDLVNSPSLFLPRRRNRIIRFGKRQPMPITPPVSRAARRAVPPAGTLSRDMGRPKLTDNRKGCRRTASAGDLPTSPLGRRCLGVGAVIAEWLLRVERHERARHVQPADR